MLLGLPLVQREPVDCTDDGHEKIVDQHLITSSFELCTVDATGNSSTYSYAGQVCVASPTESRTQLMDTIVLYESFYEDEDRGFFGFHVFAKPLK